MFLVALVFTTKAQVMNVNNAKQNVASFIYPTKRIIKLMDRCLRIRDHQIASNSRVLIGVLSKFSKPKRSVLRIAGQRFIHWIRVIRSLSNLSLYCNHCIRIFRACFELPLTRRTKTLNSLFSSL